MASPRLPPPPPSLSLSSFPQFKISTIFEIKLTPVIHGSEYTATSEVRRILGRVITKLYIPREDKIDGEIYTASPRLPPPPPSLSLSSLKY